MIPTYSNAVAQQEDRECAKEAVILALPGDAGIGISDPLIGGGASGTIVVSNLKSRMPTRNHTCALRIYSDFESHVGELHL